MLKIASEGYPFIIVFAVLTAITYIFINPWVAIIPLGVTFFMAFFFRNPERIIPGGNGIFVAPADGKVILIRDVYEGDFLKAESKEISIFMSPLNVHVNRAPCEGQVIDVKYSPGKFMAAYKDDASIRNENIVMIIDGKDGRVLVRQVAGFLARRAVCRAKVGDVLGRGEEYGIIKFSSRLDVYLPKGVEVKVKPRDKVKAGETVIAVMNK